MPTHEFRARLRFLSAALFLVLAPSIAAAVTSGAWTSNGPWGGQASAIKVVAGTPTTILVSMTAGTFRSTDGAASFQPTAGVSPTFVKDMVSTASGDLLAPIGAGLYRSTDVGLT